MGDRKEGYSIIDREDNQARSEILYKYVRKSLKEYYKSCGIDFSDSLLTAIVWHPKLSEDEQRRMIPTTAGTILEYCNEKGNRLVTISCREENHRPVIKISVE